MDATLEEPRSEFLEFLYRNNCIRTQKKQKVFYWFSVAHDRLFMDALERDLKRESMGVNGATVATPAFQIPQAAVMGMADMHFKGFPHYPAIKRLRMPHSMSMESSPRLIAPNTLSVSNLPSPMASIPLSGKEMHFEDWLMLKSPLPLLKDHRSMLQVATKEEKSGSATALPTPISAASTHGSSKSPEVVSTHIRDVKSMNDVITAGNALKPQLADPMLPIIMMSPIDAPQVRSLKGSRFQPYARHADVVARSGENQHHQAVEEMSAVPLFDGFGFEFHPVF